jgi:protein transport protein SEC24
MDPSYGGGGVAANLQQPSAGAQLFTPGLAAEAGFGGQQMPPGQPQYYGPESEYVGAPGYGQPQVAAYAQQHALGTALGGLTDQFGQMNVGAQKPFQLYTANLLTSPPDPRDLERPPPEIRLPANASISASPHANADPSYQRSTLNAIPTTSSLLSKAKIPLGLVITPYRSLNEGEDPVSVVSDTVIARCRRCRSYINPYVQFIDGGNR